MATYSAMLWTPILKVVGLKFEMVVCENVLAAVLLRIEGSLCCDLIDVRGSDVDMSLLQIGESRKLATTTAFICVSCREN